MLESRTVVRSRQPWGVHEVEKHVVKGTRTLGQRLSLLRHFSAFYLIYILFGGVFYFALPHRSTRREFSFLTNKDFSSLSPGLDRVVLVEDGEESIAVRIGLIQAAQDSIEIAYHSLHSGVVADVFFGSLLEAADRGVQVRILMDGIFHRLYGSMRDLRYVLELHPNIEFRLYEPLNIYKPWTWNNRLHDKIMIVDKKVGLISGRNIGNRYYLPEEMTNKFVFDMDVVVLTTDPANEHSGVKQLADYFALLWEHPFTKKVNSWITPSREARAQKLRTVFLDRLEGIRLNYPQYSIDALVWLEDHSLPADQVRLIHNPIMRGKKDPWVWASLVHLAQEAEESIVVQSPYIIPTRGMLKYLEEQSLAGKEVLFLTNSLASNPNLFGVAGYKGKRDFLGSWATEIWEYYGPGSLHGKALLFDQNLSAVGSFNMDARSSFLSTETMLVIKSEEFNGRLREVMRAKARHSQPILASQATPLAPWPKRLVVSLAHIFARFLDYLL